MTVSLVPYDNGCRLVFAGEITFEFWRDMEDRIIDALRRYEHIEVDLAGVEKIDLCGIHLLGILQGFGSNQVNIVADSMVVESARQRLLPSRRGMALRGRPDAGLSALAA